jgi:IS5 family transposase
MAQHILRSLVLMRVKNWDYRELREGIADGLTLRQFTDFYCQAVPKHDAFHRAFVRQTAETLRCVNEVLVQAAVGPWAGRWKKVTDRHHVCSD